MIAGYRVYIHVIGCAKPTHLPPSTHTVIAGEYSENPCWLTTANETWTWLHANEDKLRGSEMSFCIEEKWVRLGTWWMCITGHWREKERERERERERKHVYMHANVAHPICANPSHTNDLFSPAKCSGWYCPSLVLGRGSWCFELAVTWVSWNVALTGWCLLKIAAHCCCHYMQLCLGLLLERLEDPKPLQHNVWSKIIIAA